MTGLIMTRFLMCALLLGPALAWGQSGLPDRVGTEDNQAYLNRDPVSYVSEEGGFSVVFPTGCGKIVVKEPSDFPVDGEGNPLPVSYVTYCDRFQQKGEGCSVTAFFNVHGADGGPAGPPQVVERVQRMLGTMGLTVSRQKTLHRELPDGTVLEGVDVLANETAGVGESWVRGVLHNGDIFLLTAWKSDGSLATDPDYIAFFNSFEPGVE